MLLDLYRDDPWLFVAGAAVAALIGGMVVHRILAAVLQRAARPHAPVLHSMLLAAENPAGLVIPLVALQFVWSTAPQGLPYIAAIGHVNAVLLIGAFTWFAMAVLQGLATGVVGRYPTDIADNLQARRIETQARVLSRSAQTLVLITGAALVLMTFPAARHLGASLLASAGLVGIVAGLAARPLFSNLIAGLQIALAQPLRIGDVLIVKDQWGRVEEITGTYVVMHLWDDRRLVVPLNWFIENPFENWTRTSSQLTGVVLLHLDFFAPLDSIREQARKVIEAAPEWDRRVFVVQVTEATEQAMEVRILVSANDAGKLFDLRCRVREEMITWLAREHPAALPRVRQVNETVTPPADSPR
jgi:small-conductance mechanosensitive channel